MFEKWKYRRATRGFFNPDLNIDVSRNQFLQILSGDIINPYRLIDPKKTVDYSFMLLGVPEQSPLNSWAGQTWGSSGYENAHLYSDWYAKISCGSDSHVVFPKQKWVFYFDPRSNYSRGKKFDSVRDLEIALSEGSSIIGLDRDLKVLVSDIRSGEVLKYMRDFKRRFTAK